jgi:type IV pilus assembly protein PilE
MNRQRSSAGFTLIEVMIVVAIIAILAAVAYPSYLSHITRANRVAAESFMLEVTSLQQRYLLDARTYAGPPCPDVTTAGMTALGASTPSSVSANYSITTCLPASTTVPRFTVTATPIAKQATNDTQCATLTITQDGTKSATGTWGTIRCWQQ